MKKIILFISVLALGLHAGAQTKTGLLAASDNLRALMITPVRQQLEQLLADSLSYGHSGGHIDTKHEFIDKLMSGSSDFVSIDITDQTIQQYKNTGIIRYNLNAVTNDGGKPGTVKLHVLTVWVKKYKRWMLVTRQAVKIT